jgi:hypothetical protein
MLQTFIGDNMFRVSLLVNINVDFKTGDVRVE